MTIRWRTSLKSGCDDLPLSMWRVTPIPGKIPPLFCLQHYYLSLRGLTLPDSNVDQNSVLKVLTTAMIYLDHRQQSSHWNVLARVHIQDVRVNFRLFINETSLSTLHLTSVAKKLGYHEGSFFMSSGVFLILLHLVSTLHIAFLWLLHLQNISYYMWSLYYKVGNTVDRMLPQNKVNRLHLNTLLQCPWLH